MTPPRREPAPGTLDELGRLAGGVLGGEVSVATHERGKRALVTALGSRQRRPVRAAALLAAAAMALVAVAAELFWPRTALRYEVVGAPTESGYVRVPAGGPEAALRFSDGTEVVFAAGARGHVAEVGAHGAGIVVEDGLCRVHVAHLPGAQWEIDAGPFVIAVTGTDFDVAWDAEEGAIDVRLRVGSVMVRGPSAPAGVALHAGQRLTARPGDSEPRIEEAGADRLDPGAAPREPSPPPAIDGSATASAQAPSPVPPLPSTVSGERAAAPPKASATPRSDEAAPSWPRRVKSGDFRGVLAEAETRGFDATLVQAPLADLEALADAARYAGRADLAGKVLRAERSRFAGTAEAKTAAFLLGRLAEDAQASPGTAIGYYDAYLSEAPDGAFASEALGRKMNAVYRSEGAAAARPIAEAYLHRFPGGTYASVAQQLTRP